MAEHETGPEPVRTRSRGELIVVAVAGVLMLGAAGVVIWVLSHRLQDVQGRLTAVERQAAAAQQDAQQKSRELTAVQSKLIEAQDRALRAEHRAYELETTNRESESQVDQLRQESERAAAAAAQAAKEREQALASRQQAVSELENLRRRRAEELDRMQQALNRVAPTHRTPTGMVMQLANDAFRFDFDSAELRPANRETLSRIAGVLLASQGYRLFIDGHTDDVGTAEYNQGLSERRAKSVRDYLVKAGVPADIISVNGFGKSNPLVKEKTREAREKNRRVEIGIVDTIINYQTTVASKAQ